MRVTLLAVVAALLLGACSPGDDTPASSTTEVGESASTTTAVPTVTTGPDIPGQGGIAVVGVFELPTTLNPVAAGGTRPASTVVQQAVLPGAYFHDPETWRAMPNLVVRIPSADEGDVVLTRDRQQVTWTIDPSASWSDGMPVGGEDFAFTLRALLGATACGGREGAGSFFGFEIIDVEPKSITVEMPGPTLAYETMFSAVLPAHVTDGTTVCTDDGVGWPSAGPFVASAIGDDRVSVRRNDAYWRGASALAGVDFVLIDETSAPSALAAGDVHVVVTSDPATAAAADGTVVAQSSARFEHLGFNFAIRENDVDPLVRYRTFRQAIARSIDKAALAESIGWVSADGVLRGVEPAAPWSTLGHDPDEARRLVAATCEEIGRDCESEPPQLRIVATDFGVRSAVVDAVVAGLEAIDVDVAVEIVASAALQDRLASGNWDLTVLAFSESAGTAAAARNIISRFDEDGIDNVYRYGGSGSVVATERSAFQLRLFLGQMAVSPDRGRVRQLLGEAHALLGTDVVMVPLVAQSRFTIVADDRLDGVVANAGPSGVTWNVGDWKLTDA